MHTLSRWTAALALAGLIGSVGAAAPDGPEFTLDHFTSAPGRLTASDKVQPDRTTSMAELHGWLRAEAAPLAKGAGGITVTLTRQDRFDIGEAVCSDCSVLDVDTRRKQVGVAKPVGLVVDFDQRTLKKGGAWRSGGLRAAADGGFVWTLPVASKGAHGLRIGFSGLDLPAGAELYVYNAAGEAHGPYTGHGSSDGTLVSNMVTGDTAFVQLRVWGAPDRAELRQLGFTIDHVGHIGSGFELARKMNPSLAGGAKAFCSYNASCIVNGDCVGSSTWGAIDSTRSGVAHMLFRSGGFFYICSGGLLDNTAGDGAPLFLTANHCMSREREADSLETFWDFRADCGTTDYCNDSYETLRASFHTTLGAAILATGKSGDFSLLRLDQTPGGTRYYLPWTNSPVASSDNTNLFRLSHPQGAPQSFSRHAVDANSFTCTGYPRGTYIYSEDVSGATEGGSSGSPVMNGSGQVVGQLFGACGTNLGDECDAVNNRTMDGAMAHYFGNVEPWLDPDGGGDPGGDSIATVTGVSVSTSSKGPWIFYTATVSVIDQNGQPLANATVSGTWSGAVSGSGSGTTDGSGTATIDGGRVRNGGSATFCVTDVSGSGITFDGNSVCGSGG